MATCAPVTTAGSEQSSGPILFDDVGLASLYIRFRGKARLERDLYFAIPAANSDGDAHIRLDKNGAGLAFEDTNADGTVEFNDMLIVINRLQPAN